MSDYISRNRAIRIAEQGQVQGYEWQFTKLVNEPSADVRENIHGTWEEWKGKVYENVPICSNCKHGFPLIAKEYNFCPNCGAEMKVEPTKGD